MLALATQLAPADKLRLIEHLAPQITPALEDTRVQREEARARRQRFREELLAYGLVSPTAGEIIDADRKAWDSVLWEQYVNMYTIDANIFARDADPHDTDHGDCHACLASIERDNFRIVAPLYCTTRSS